MLGPSRCELTHHAWYQSSTFMFRVLPSGINPPSLVQASAQGTKPGGFIFFLQRCLPPRQKHGELGTECRENFKSTHAAWHQSAVRAARGAMEPSQGGQGGQGGQGRQREIPCAPGASQTPMCPTRHRGTASRSRPTSPTHTKCPTCPTRLHTPHADHTHTTRPMCCMRHTHPTRRMRPMCLSRPMSPTHTLWARAPRTLRAPCLAHAPCTLRMAHV